MRHLGELQHYRLFVITMLEIWRHIKKMSEHLVEIADAIDGTRGMHRVLLSVKNFENKQRERDKNVC